MAVSFALREENGKMFAILYVSANRTTRAVCYSEGRKRRFEAAHIPHKVIADAIPERHYGRMFIRTDGTNHIYPLAISTVNDGYTTQPGAYMRHTFSQTQEEMEGTE